MPVLCFKAPGTLLMFVTCSVDMRKNVDLASRLEAITLSVEAIALSVEAIASRVDVDLQVDLEVTRCKPQISVFGMSATVPKLLLGVPELVSHGLAFWTAV